MCTLVRDTVSFVWDSILDLIIKTICTQSLDVVSLPQFGYMGPNVTYEFKLWAHQSFKPGGPEIDCNKI